MLISKKKNVEGNNGKLVPLKKKGGKVKKGRKGGKEAWIISSDWIKGTLVFHRSVMDPWPRICLCEETALVLPS